MGKTSAEVKNRYNAKVYDRVTLVVKKGEKDKIRAAAEAAGESVNVYISRAITERIGFSIYGQ